MWQFPFNTIITQFIATVHIGCRAYIYPCRMSTTETRVSQWHCNYTRCLLHTSLVGQALWTFKRPMFDLCIVMSRWVLRSGVNYKGLYDNLRMCFWAENKGHELTKKWLTLSPWYLASVCVPYFGHFSTIPVGFRFAEHFPLSIRYTHTHIYVYPQKLGHFGSNSILWKRLQRKQRGQYKI